MNFATNFLLIDWIKSNLISLAAKNLTGFLARQYMYCPSFVLGLNIARRCIHFESIKSFRWKENIKPIQPFSFGKWL